MFLFVTGLLFLLRCKDGALEELVRKRYSSFDSEVGALIEVILISMVLFTFILAEIK